MPTNPAKTYVKVRDPKSGVVYDYSTTSKEYKRLVREGLLGEFKDGVFHSTNDVLPEVVVKASMKSPQVRKQEEILRATPQNNPYAIIDKSRNYMFYYDA